MLLQLPGRFKLQIKLNFGMYNHPQQPIMGIILVMY